MYKYAVLLLLIVLVYIVILKRRFLKKNMLQMDSELDRFLYSDFDCRAESNPDREDTYKKNGKEFITGSGKRNMDKVFVKNLDQVAVEFQRKTRHKIWERINSAYRTKERNDYVGGVNNSAHLKGLAVDISTIGMTAEEVEQLIDLCKQYNIKRIGRYNTFIHVDMDYSKPIAEW